MPDAREPPPELSPEELKALITQAGLELSADDQANVLVVARFLRRAAALVRAYDRPTGESDP